MNISYEIIAKEIPASVYIVKFNFKTERIEEIDIINHIPYSGYDTSFLEKPQNLKKIALPEDFELFIKKLKELKHKESVEFVARIISKNKVFKFLSVYLKVIKKEKDCIYALGYNVDVSEREEFELITEKLFSYKHIGFMIYQEKIVFVNDYLSKKLGIKAEDDTYDIFGYDEEFAKNIKRRLRGEFFEMFYPYREFIVNNKKFYCDVFADTVIFKGKYSGFVIMVDKTEKVKKDMFLEMVANIHSLFLSEKNVETFLQDIVDLINSKGYNSQIVYKDRKFGECKNLLSRVEFKEDNFEFIIESKYENDFECCEDLAKGLGSEIKYAAEYLVFNKYLVLLKKSFDESFQAIVITDEEFNIVYCNKVFSELKDGITNLNEIFNNLDINEDKPVEKILIGYVEGKHVFLKAKIIPVYYDKKYYVFQSIILNDEHVVVDYLTNLLNRKGFLEKNYLDSKKVIVVIDIYEFKSIIESRGKKYAEEILKKLASFLKKEIGVSKIGRVGGDEFAFVIDIEKNELKNFLNKLIAKINAFLNLNVNIGVVVVDDKENNLEILLEKAYVALNKAIKEGGNTYKIYDENIGLEKKKIYIVHNLIKRAVKENNIIFYFQPYVNQDFKVAGAESLIRIKEKERIIPPAEFIEEAEESGLISDIEKITFPKIVEYAKKVDINLSFNLSAYSFIHNEFYESIPEVKNLTIEITERIVTNMQLAKEKIDIIKSKNIKVAIDDFGTGYSNFMSLKELDFDFLKIDMSFIRFIETSKKDRAIVKSIVEFAKSLDLKTVAEGVETEKQVEILKDLGCDYMQGFYFYKPMPFEKLKKLLGGEK